MEKQWGVDDGCSRYIFRKENPTKCIRLSYEECIKTVSQIKDQSFSMKSFAISAKDSAFQKVRVPKAVSKYEKVVTLENTLGNFWFVIQSKVKCMLSSSTMIYHYYHWIHTYVSLS